MFPLDHYEWRMPRMHYGRKNTREYARRLYRDAEGNVVLPMFSEPEEQYREFSFGYPHEQTVERKVLKPHFHRMAMEERELHGHATFQLSPEEEPPRKCGRPCKTLSAVWGPSRVFTGKCQCGVLSQKCQGDRPVVEYTEDFLNQAKLCKPKSEEMWAGWYKNGLRRSIQLKLKGVLEPLEFALVKRMAGFAIEAEEKMAAQSAALLSPEAEDPRMDGGSLGASAGEPPKKKRGRPRKSPIASCDCGVLCQPKPAEEWCRLFKAGLCEDIRDELDGVLEPLEFALVKRVDGQALAAEEWLAKRDAEAEFDRLMEEWGDPDLDVEDGHAVDPGSEADHATRHCGWLSS
ncbi:hypothetical protein Bca101_067769 [Brassica carinata]